jgi:hypothetical protein
MNTPTRWTIYCHIHIDSGRRYIGLTSKTMLRRWNSHILNAKSKKGKGCHHFWNAIRKYGKDAFSHEVLEVCDTLEAANTAENKWISQFNTRDPQFGFNLSKGGEHTPHPFKNPWNDPEYRAKMLGIKKKFQEDPKFRAKLVLNNIWNGSERITHVVKSSATARNLWKDPEYRKKICGVRVISQVIVKTESKPITQEYIGICSRCKKSGEFGRDCHKKSGFKCVCKNCEKAERINKKEIIRLRSKKYREANKEKSRNYQSTYYVLNHDRILNRDRRRRSLINDRVIERRNSLIDFVNQIKKAPCQICNYVFDPSNVEFYPIESQQHSIKWMTYHNCSKQRVLDEIKKCELLCVDCYKNKSSYEIVRSIVTI